MSSLLSSYFSNCSPNLESEGSRAIHAFFNLERDSGRQDLKLIEQAERYLKIISVDCQNPDISFSLMTHIAKYCVSLEKLSLYTDPDAQAQDFDCWTLPVNHSITTLVLQHCKIAPNLFSLASTLFPCLKTFYFKQSEFGSNDLDRWFVMFMPSLSLE